MGNLYRNLKRKLEGSNVTDAISNKINRRVGGLTSIKQGMAAALAEMTKRYFTVEITIHHGLCYNRQVDMANDDASWCMISLFGFQISIFSSD